MSFRKIHPIDFMSCLLFSAFKASSCFNLWSLIVFTCFSNALLRAEYVNLACSIICL